MTVRSIAATILLAWSWQTASGQSVSWNMRPGLVIDISGNTAGALWALGIERVNDSGYKVFRFDGSDWKREYNAPPGRRVVVGPKGEIWILDEQKNIHNYGVSSQILGQANDLAVGADGSVWIIGTPEAAGGFRIYKWTGSGWANVAGGAVRIAVERDGTPWVVNDTGKIFRYNAASNGWDQKPGTAHSVHTGATSGAVWMLGVEPVIGGFPIYRWNAMTQNWEAYGSYGAVTITEVADRSWIVQSGGSVFSKSLPLADPITLEFTPAAPPMTPQEESPVRVQTAGKLLCSATGTTSCGDTKADYVGAYTLDTTCDEGFYDMIYGGTCWKCPDDTDGKGAWIRSADHIEKDTACWRVPTESTAKAVKVKSPAWAWDCPSGSFWDGYSPDGIGGSCWQCPADHPRRTLAAVWADNACATPLNETRPATLLSFNGCPKPDAATMGLPGKRTPGNPFLDIAAGWSQAVASGGCYACPITDETGNFLITERNGNPLYSKDNNLGCTIQLKWQPPPFPDPGLTYLQGVKQVIWDQELFSGDKITGFLYDVAEAKELGDATPEAKAWVEAQWQEIGAKPYNSESFRAFMFAVLRTAMKKTAEARTPGEQKLIQSFQSYIQDRRIYLAEQGLAMYDAWKAHDDRYRIETGQTNSLGQLFYYGTVPFNFQKTIGGLMGLGSVGGGTLGALASANAFIKTLQWVDKTDDAGNVIKQIVAARSTLHHLTYGLNIFKSVHGLTAASGATIVSAVGIILSSIAIEQLVEIESARPRLEASLAEARNPVDLNAMAKTTGGEDMLFYYWAKAMDTVDAEDPEVVQLAAQARARAHGNGYQAPPKQLVEVTFAWINAGSAVSSGTGAASPFDSPGLAQTEMLVSPNGKYEARMQIDGNFVIYADGAPIWATGTVGRADAPYRLAMQPDGNLALYGSSKADVSLSGFGVCRAKSPCIAIWSTGPRGGTAPYSLEMQDDGNFVMYDSARRPVWASETRR